MYIHTYVHCYGMQNQRITYVRTCEVKEEIDGAPPPPPPRKHRAYARDRANYFRGCKMENVRRLRGGEVSLSFALKLPPLLVDVRDAGERVSVK
jgi:hypothetical protein